MVSSRTTRGGRDGASAGTRDKLAHGNSGKGDEARAGSNQQGRADDGDDSTAANAKASTGRPLAKYALCAIAAAVALIALLAAIGWSDVDDSADATLAASTAGSDDDAATRGIFSVPATCTPDEFVERADAIVGNLTATLDRLGATTLHDWVLALLASDGEAPSPSAQRRVLSHVTFALARWAKGVKSLTASVEKHCDVETVLNSRGFASSAASASSATAAARATTTGDVTVHEHIGTHVLPELYRAALRLLEFSLSGSVTAAGRASAGADDDVTATTTLIDRANRRIAKDVGAVAQSLQPYRDVVLRTVMSLCDVAFTLEREDYHVAFLAQLVRVVDGVAWLHSTREQYHGGAAPAGGGDGGNAWPPCHDATNQVFCSAAFGSRLVRAPAAARSGGSASGSASDELLSSNAHLFGLLRSAYLEELIALRQASVAARIAYGASLLELQRYESAQKALQAAQRALDEQSRAAATPAPTMDAAAALAAAPAVLGSLLACLDEDDMLEHLSEQQRRYPSRIAAPWAATVALPQCARGGRAVTPRQLRDAVSLAWPLRLLTQQGAARAEDDEPPALPVQLIMV